MPIRLVLADDHPLLLDGLENLFATEPDLEVVGRCADGRRALDAVESLKPDVLILDLRMPGLSGGEILRTIRDRKLPVRVVVLTASADEDELFAAVRLGAHGVVLKEMAPRFLIQAVRKVHAGEPWLERKTLSRALNQLLLKESGAVEVATRLTPRELDIVRMLAQGRRNRDIGERLGVSEGTVKVHLHNIYEKLGVDGRLALVRLAETRGWI